MTGRYSVVQTDGAPSADCCVEDSVFAQSGLSVEYTRYECVEEQELIGLCSGAHALIASYAPITRRVLDAVPDCRIVATMATGFDCVDVEYATDQGIVVCNAGAYCSHEVADHAIALLLCLSRRILGLHSAVLSGVWKSSACDTPGDLRKQTLGIVGLGRIGSRVALRAQAFGLRVAAYDPYVDRSRMDLLNVEKVTFESLVEDSDYVSLQCPLTDETRGIVNRLVLAAMKPSAFLINTGRGECVETAALADALERSDIAGAGLDVVCPEPLPAWHRLCSLPNVVITPHAAFRSTSSVLELRRRPCQQVVMALKDEPPELTVNPEVLGRTNCRVKCSGGSRQMGLRP